MLGSKPRAIVQKIAGAGEVTERLKVHDWKFWGYVFFRLVSFQ